jgi:putative ABC transport system permease protein
VVGDIKNQGPDQPAQPEVFVPFTVTERFQPGLLVRTAVDPRSLVRQIQREIWAIDRNVAGANIDTIENTLRQFTYATPRFSLIVMAVFAGVGLVLVTVGVFSVMAYTVAGQTHEIGIRMALGASHHAVLAMILRRGLLIVGLGIIAGLAVTFAAARALASQLTNVEPWDPLTLASVVVVIALTGLAACWLPARRATKVDPIIALRAE